MARLERSRHKSVFFKLAQNFEPQENGYFCGVATAAIALNALRSTEGGFKRPVDESKLPKEKRIYIPATHRPPVYERYTQHNVFLAGTKTELEVLGKPIEIKGKQTADFGLQIRQLHELMLAHQLSSKLRIADATFSDDQIRAELVAALDDSGSVAIVNFKRSEIGQEGKGSHISPLGAYDQVTDSFLILDVNSSLYSWVWADAAALIKGMRTFDMVENRGYLVVSERGH